MPLEVLLGQLGRLARLTPLERERGAAQHGEILGSTVREERVGLFPASLTAPQVGEPDQRYGHYSGLHPFHVPVERLDLALGLGPLAPEVEQ